MNQESQSIEERVIHIIHTKMGVRKEKILLPAHLQMHLGLDSLDAVELMIELEKEFAITINDQEADNFHTVHDLVSYIEKKTT